MIHGARFSEAETLSSYIDTIVSSMEAVLPTLIARYGPEDPTVNLTKEAIVRIRDLYGHVMRLPNTAEMAACAQEKDVLQSA